MWKGVKRNVERQNNNENQYGRNRRKDKRRKLFFYRAACAMLGLLIVCVIFGAVYFLRESKDPALPSKENTGSKCGADTEGKAIHRLFHLGIRPICSHQTQLLLLMPRNPC